MKSNNAIYRLSELIKFAIGQDNPYEDLTNQEKSRLIDYLRSLPIKNGPIFGKVGYDALSSTFFAEYYEFNSILELISNTRTFNSLEDLINLVGTGIYSDSCFFGLSKQEDELKKCGVDASRLNFDSFINYDVDDLTLIKLFYPDKTSPLYIAGLIKDWYLKLPDKIDSKALSKIFESYADINGIANSLNNVSDALGILFEKYGDELFNPIIRYCLDKGPDVFKNCNLNFDDIAFLFGNGHREELLNFLDDLKTSEYLRAKYRKQLKTIKLFTKKSIEVDFDRKHGTFCFSTWEIFENSHIDVGFKFFDFDSLARFLHNDFSGLDLSSLPITADELNKCKIDDSTILPILLVSPLPTKSVEKGFDGKQFNIKLKWTNKDGNVVGKIEKNFSYFCDFVHFLKGDLSFADLSLCNGLENLKNIGRIDFSNAFIPSSAADVLQIAYTKSEVSKDDLHHSKASKDNERLPANAKHIEPSPAEVAYEPEKYTDNYCIGYVSDIHITDKFYAKKCKNIGDKMRIAYGMADSLSASSIFNRINIIAGDVAAPIDDFGVFFDCLRKRKCSGNTFLVLGNHELFMSSPAVSIDESIKEHREIARRNGVYLLENSAFYCSVDNRICEIKADELLSISADELRLKTRGSTFMIFGGFGLVRQDGKDSLAEFRNLYNKVAASQRGRNLIVVTHIPTTDFIGLDELDPGVIYLHGHTHRQFYFEKGLSRIIADNQIGYRRSKIEFKHFYINEKTDWFDTFENGIYEISKDDYLSFYGGLSKPIDFYSQYEKIYLIKRNGAYLFLMKTPKGELRLLNGGAIRVVPDHPLEYFYDKLDTMLNSVELCLHPYFEKQKAVSDWVKSFGGDGSIHGCIIDIDFYNHIFLNPIDGTLVPYYATSIVDKYVYRSIKSLISSRCHWLLESFMKKKDDQPLLPSTKQERNSPAKRAIHVESTYMYRVSNIVKTLQYASNLKLIRFWDDSLVAESSKANGLAIFQKTLLEIEEKK